MFVAFANGRPSFIATQWLERGKHLLKTPENSAGLQTVQNKVMDYLSILGLIYFFSALIGCSIFFTLKSGRRVVSALLATIAAALSVQAISYAHLGYFDPFYEIAFVVSLLIGLPVALFSAYLTQRNTRKSTGVDFSP